MSDEKTLIFEQNRRALESIAYRMLGTLSDARDVVQETDLKWREIDDDTLHSPRAWLITVCSRIALNQLKSARMHRELYPRFHSAPDEHRRLLKAFIGVSFHLKIYEITYRWAGIEHGLSVCTKVFSGFRWAFSLVYCKTNTLIVNIKPIRCYS